jgi:hypothetical protein
MKRHARNLVAAVLAAAVAFSVAPAASAAPKDKPAHVKTYGKAHGKAKGLAKKVAAMERRTTSGKPSAARKGAAQQRVVIRDVNRRITRLDRVVTGDRLAGLDQGVIDAITANVAFDKAALSTILDGLATDTRPVREIRGEVRTYRVETYNVVVGIAREAAAVAETAAANDAALADLVTSGAAPAELVFAVQLENVTAVESARNALTQALALTATSPVSDRAAAEAYLVSAQESLAVVATFLAGYPATAEPVTEDPYVPVS